MKTVGAYLFHAAALSILGLSLLLSPASAALPGTVVAWGYNDYGQATVPAGLSGVTAITAGYDHTVALKTDGTVVAWGHNYYGQTNVPAGLSGVTAIAAGGYHTVALKADGTVVAWGRSSEGQTTVPAGLSGVTAIAAGGEHTVALKTDGTVVAWGDNSYGQNTVPAGLNGVTAIAAGVDHTVALKTDGTVVAWGFNYDGQVTGTRSTSSPYSATANPVTLGGQVLSGVTAIAGGENHTVALKTDGTVVAWGDNSYGQTNVPAGLSGVTAITAGYVHTVALKTDGTVVAWGNNYYGQVTGTPSTSSPYSATANPVTLGGHVLRVTAIATGLYHTVALTAAPNIVSQPTALAVKVTSNAMFAVAATGPTPLSYQWFGLSPLLTGATGTALVAGGFVFDAQVTGGGTGYVQAPAVRFVGGGGSGATATAMVSNGAVTALTIGNPGSGYTSPPTVQIDPPNGFLPGQTNATLTLTNVGTNDAGTYFVVVTNAYGSVTSSPATLTVNVPVTITQQPSGAVIPFGSNATFTVGAGGTVPLSYQWFWQPAFARTALAVPDVRNGFIVGAAVITGGGHYFTPPAVQFLAGSGSGATATTTISDGRVTAVNILSPGSGYPSNTVIQIDPPPAGPAQSLPGQTAATLALTAPGALASGTYFAIVTNAGGSATSSPALLRVLVPQRFPQPPERLGDGSFRLRFIADDGGYLLTNDLPSLEVWGSTNLANPAAWLRLTNGITVTNGEVLVDDADSPGLPRRFYRVLTR